MEEEEEKEEEESPFVVVEGMRYVRPYLRQTDYAVRLGAAGASVASVLATAFRRGAQSEEAALTHFSNEVRAGRVLVEHHRRFRGDQQMFRPVDDPEMPTAKGDRLRLTNHVHERATVFRGPVQFLWRGEDGKIAAVYKPAGLPVVDDIGGHATVTGCLPGRWKLGHRLDVPVQGVLLVASGGGGASTLIKALAPEEKQGAGVVKCYRARVRGKLMREGRIELSLYFNTVDKVSTVKEDKGRPTVTMLSNIVYDAASDTSLVTVHLQTGARHQIRGVLAHLGHPIVYDHAYGGGVEPPCDEPRRLYRDNSSNDLKNMLQANLQPWCDKCRWMLEATEQGGMTRGADRAHHYIQLLSYHYVIPALNIDVRVPPNLIPDWARYPED